MVKLVILKLGEGNFEQGFPVTLQMGEEGLAPKIEFTSHLPPAPQLPNDYRCWQTSYRHLGSPSRLEAKTAFITNVSYIENCDRAAQILSDRFNEWLNSPSFRAIREKLLEQLSPSEEIRILLQTKDAIAQRLPWHLWDLCDRYPKAEIALSAPVYQQIEHPQITRAKVRILAILGHSKGINIQADRELLDRLPNAEVSFLIEPQRQELNDWLWDAQGWDILFFAGHSLSHEEGMTGQIFINQNESLSIPQLKHGLKKAIQRGLKIAIFNSCDGLGLAQQLADLHIPQILVMREPVPDRVAQEFLKYFLEAFAKGDTFYLSVREAREKLQGLEAQFPYATWLPTIYQNPAAFPPTWESLHIPQKAHHEKVARHAPLQTILITSIAIASLISGIRHLGILQPLELKSYDRLLAWRTQEKPDSRLLVVTVTEADIGAQNPETRRGSLSDEFLAQLLQKLETFKPRAIGLDIYRDYPVSNNYPNLVQKLQHSDRLIAICKVSDRSLDEPGISPPPEVPPEQIGFSDFIVDSDGVIRRHLLVLTPEPTSLCQASYSFSVQLAFRYLAAEGVLPQWTPDGYLQLGKVIFQPLETNTGIYQKSDLWGHQILLNYRRDRAIERVTLSDVLQNRINPNSFRDRIIIIGTTAPSFGDYWLTPFSQDSSPAQQVPGVLMQAQMTSQILGAILDKRPLLCFLSGWSEIVGIWVCALIGATIAWRVGLSDNWGNTFIKLAISISIAIIGLCGLGLTVLTSGYILPIVPFSFAVIAASSTVVVFEIRFQKGKLPGGSYEIDSRIIASRDR
ncbi:MAG: CHASE2 domain-containing protein [Hydrococcus sp. Prado102]|nr:CHASE2 domain-containing protein [Hydrococcus sp. Prado102]